jgi:putative MATE family efflux protein
MSFGQLANSIMQASGDAQWPMRVTVAERIFHIILCPFLIFGWGGIFPAMGVTGAALSGVIAQGLGGAVLLWIIFSGRTRLQISLRRFKFNTNIIWRMVKIGIPSAISGIHFSIGSMIFMWFITPFGTAAVAGHNLVSRVDMFIMLPAMGLGTAAGILAAQNLGANRPDRSAKTSWIAVGWLTGVMAIFSIIIWLWAPGIVQIFSPDTELVELASLFLKIQIASYMCNGLMFVLMSVMNSVGDTLIAFIIDLVTMWGIRVPLAVILPRIAGLGIYGIRWALVADTVFSAVVFIIYFWSGRWKRKQI